MPIWLIKYLPHLLGIGAVVALGWFAYNWAYERGEATGRAEVQAEWDAENEEIARQRALQEATARAKEEADRKAAEEIQDALQEKLDSADARARDLARRLRQYQARACASTVPQDAGSAPLVDPAAGVPEDGGTAGQLLEEHLAACARDAERLSGWQDWWKRVQ